MKHLIIISVFYLSLTGCTTDKDCYNKELADQVGIGCPSVIDPVCACNGETYQNECHANAEGYKVVYKGRCR